MVKKKKAETFETETNRKEEEIGGEPADLTASEEDGQNQGFVEDTLNAELEECRQRLYRMQADFDNYRKRVLKDRSSAGQDAVDAFVVGLLPVMDNLERAIQAARESQGEKKMLEGVEKIYRQLRDVIEREGITPMECIGEPFDPVCHQAIHRVCIPEQPENTIVEEAQRGYRRCERVIRPAMVVVSTQDEE